MATRLGEPVATRSASVSAIHSRSSVPETFSRRTPSARATATVSVMISSARRRTKRCRMSTPRRSPPTVPSEEMAQLMASFDQRAPARLSVIDVGPTASRRRASSSRRARSGPAGASWMRPITKPPDEVRSYTPGSTIDAPQATMAPRVRSGPTIAAMRSSHSPFWKHTIAPPGASAGSAWRAASSTCGGCVARSTKSKGAAPAGTARVARPRTVPGLPSPRTRKPCSFTASQMSGLVVSAVTSWPCSTRCAATIPPMPPQPTTRRRGEPETAATLAMPRPYNGSALAATREPQRSASTPPRLTRGARLALGRRRRYAGGTSPTGQLTPVPPMPQYPSGFLARYCWWYSSA